MEGEVVLGAPLTGREFEVLRLRATEGLPLKAVAHRLGLTEQTAKNHSARAFAKLGVSSLVEAMRALGWVAALPYADYLARQLDLEAAAHRARVEWIAYHGKEQRRLAAQQEKPR